MGKVCELMVGIKPVCDAFDITREQFYMFLALGMPMRKINGRWYGHRQNISEFFRSVTHGKPINVDGDKVMKIDGGEA